MRIKLEHRDYQDVESFGQHDARAVLLNARAHLLEQELTDEVFEAFNLLGKAFDKVWLQGPGFVDGAY